MHPPGCALGRVRGLAAPECTLPKSLPPGKAAWLQQEHSFWLLGTLLVLRIQPSIHTAGLRAWRKFGGGSEWGGFVGIF